MSNVDWITSEQLETAKAILSLLMVNIGTGTLVQIVCVWTVIDATSPYPLMKICVRTMFTIGKPMTEQNIIFQMVHGECMRNV